MTAQGGASFGLTPSEAVPPITMFSLRITARIHLLIQEDDPLSTFGMDVDTASYSVTRRYLRDGYLPPPEAVRVEEFVNAFDYNYPAPSAEAFAVHIEGAPSQFGNGGRLRLPEDRKRLRLPRDDEQLQLLRIGIQGRVVPDENRKDATVDLRD